MLLRPLDNKTVTVVRSGASWASRIVGRIVGRQFVTGKTATGSVIIHNCEFCGEDSLLRLDCNSGRYCLSVVSRNITNSLGETSLMRIAGRTLFQALTSCAHRQGIICAPRPKCKRRCKRRYGPRYGRRWNLSDIHHSIRWAEGYEKRQCAGRDYGAENPD